MGDVRFEVPYSAVRDARDRAAAIAAMTDEEVIAALAGASRGNDPLLANVLATAAMNRNARLLAIVQNIGEAVALLKRDGAPVLIDPAFSRMLGWTIDELRQAAVHERVHPLCDEGADCPLVDALLSGREHQVDNDVLVRRDGARLPVAYTITPLSGRRGTSGRSTARSSSRAT